MPPPRQTPSITSAILTAAPKIGAAAVLVAAATFVLSLTLRPPPPRPAQPPGTVRAIDLWILFQRGEWAAILEEIELAGGVVDDRWFSARMEGWAAERLASEAESEIARAEARAMAEDAFTRLLALTEPPTASDETEFDATRRHYFRAFALQGLGSEGEATALFAECAGILERLSAQPGNQRTNRLNLLAHARAGAGDAQGAIDAMTAAVQRANRTNGIQRHNIGTYVTLHPVFAPLDTPSFADQVSDMDRLRRRGLEQYARALIADGQAGRLADLTQRILSDLPDLRAAFYLGVALDLEDATAQRRRSAWQRVRDLLGEVDPMTPIMRPDASLDEPFNTAGWAARGLGDAALAEALFERAMSPIYAIPEERRGWVAWYNIACGNALIGRLDEALAAFERYAAFEGDNSEWAVVDPDLTPLRESAEHAGRFFELVTGRTESASAAEPAESPAAAAP